METDFRLEEIAKAAKIFVDSIGKDRLFAFDGKMGAGKTTFIAEVCKLLGVDDDFGSPTFSLVNEYRDRQGNPIYHFGFYRIESPEEVLDMGAEEYFYSGNLCFMEWHEKIGNILPEETRIVRITENPDGSRRISF